MPDVDVPELAPHWQHGVVRDAMLVAPKTLPAEATVADVRAAFEHPKTRMVLLADAAGVLRGVIAADALPAAAAPDEPAVVHAVLDGSTTAPDASLHEAHQRMLDTGLRRLAVIDDAHRLVGLLCLTRDSTGFCS